MLFYSGLLYLLTPYLYCRLWWKGRRLPGYRQRIKERFGLGYSNFQVFDVWVHAVSLGEVITATPLINELLAAKQRVLITTMTPTGASQVQKSFSNRVIHRYIPYDLPDALKRFFNYHQARVGLIMETELWPNLIGQAHRAGIRLFLVNARLSSRSYQGYKKLRWFFAPLLNRFSLILAQSTEDAARFSALATPFNRATSIEVVGNLKFDLPPIGVLSAPLLQLKQAWGKTRPVVIFASTHDDEEAQILTHYRQLQAAIPNLMGLIAPRHPERFEPIYQLIRQQGWAVNLRSQPTNLNATTDFLLIDSIGELSHFYALSDYAFVGGSLVPVGGHNLLEPINCHIPVFTGPYLHNFQTISRQLLELDALQIVENGEQLIKKMITLHQNPLTKQQVIRNAHHLLELNRGASWRCFQAISPWLDNH